MKPPQRRHDASDPRTIEKIMKESDSQCSDVLHFLIHGGMLDVSLADEDFLASVYDDQLRWQVRKRMREQSIEGPAWIETLERRRVR
jgi:hypothetical protein